MNKVSDRIAALSPSQTLAMAQKSLDLKAQGIDVISLSVGQPDFNTPDYIKEAAKKAIDDNFSFYSPVPGFPDLREAIANKFKRENNLEYTPEQIVVSNGGKHSIANIFMALLNKDDEVIIPTPYWVTYPELVKVADGTPVFIKSTFESDFKITPEQLENAITEKTKAFIFSSPSNPTGSVYSKEELKALADVFANYENILIITDEIYEHINFAGKHESIAQFENIKDRVIIVNGVSKSYAMTGWRIGYIAAPEWIAKACSKLQSQMTSGASSIAQKASVAAINSDSSCTLKMKEEFKKRRDLAYKLLSKIDGIKINKPQGAFYFFPEVSNFIGKSFDGKKITDSSDLSIYLLNKAHVATVGGTGFGHPECIRLSYAISQERLKEAIDRIAKALAQLK